MKTKQELDQMISDKEKLLEENTVRINNLKSSRKKRGIFGWLNLDCSSDPLVSSIENENWYLRRDINLIKMEIWRQENL